MPLCILKNRFHRLLKLFLGLLFAVRMSISSRVNITATKGEFVFDVEGLTTHNKAFVPAFVVLETKYDSVQSFKFAESQTNTFTVVIPPETRQIEVEFGRECLLPVLGYSFDQYPVVKIASSGNNFHIQSEYLGIAGFNRVGGPLISSRTFDRLEEPDGPDKSDLYTQGLNYMNLEETLNSYAVIFCPFFSNKQLMSMSFDILIKRRLDEFETVLQTNDGFIAAVAATVTVPFIGKHVVKIPRLQRNTMITLNITDSDQISALITYKTDGNMNSHKDSSPEFVLPPSEDIEITLLNPTSYTLHVLVTAQQSAKEAFSSSNSVDPAVVIGPVIGGLALIVITVLLFCYRKRIRAFFSKKKFDESQFLAHEKTLHHGETNTIESYQDAALLMMAQTKDLRDPISDIEKNRIVIMDEKEKQLLLTPNTANTQNGVDTNHSISSHVYPTLIDEGIETIDVYQKKLSSGTEAGLFNTPSRQMTTRNDNALNCSIEDNIPIMRIKVQVGSEPTRQKKQEDNAVKHEPPVRDVWKETLEFKKLNLFPK